MVMDMLSGRHSASFRPGKGSYYIARARLPKTDAPVVMIKPTTFMNRSGIAAAQVLEHEELGPGEVLVVMDDFELPFGELRLRKKGSAGSHNGMKSIIRLLETGDIPRIRMGIGPVPERADPADYVLSNFSPAHRKKLEDFLSGAANAVEVAVSRGMDIAMNSYNGMIEDL